MTTAIICNYCEEKMLAGQSYKILPVSNEITCDECWPAYEEGLVANRNWQDLILWDDLEVHEVGEDSS